MALHMSVRSASKLTCLMLAALPAALQSVDAHGYPLEELVKKLEANGTKHNLVLVDACRSATRGDGTDGMVRATQDEDMWRSSKVELTQGLGATLLCHACSKLQVAQDGRPGENGVYTAALLKVGSTPDHEELRRTVRLLVSYA